MKRIERRSVSVFESGKEPKDFQLFMDVHVKFRVTLLLIETPAKMATPADDLTKIIGLTICGQRHNVCLDTSGSMAEAEDGKARASLLYGCQNPATSGRFNVISFAVEERIGNQIIPPTPRAQRGEFAHSLRPLCGTTYIQAL